jgi:endonuclease/exonuclease/phosphatase family metal-dependent hydrolase
MNLCLSGIARCVPSAQPSETVTEALAQVRKAEPDLVVLNEACSRDAARIATAGRLHLTFSKVTYLGTTLPCRHPAGRGVFGNAVLTAGRPMAVHDQAFGLQDGIEERRVVCVDTAPLRVCGTHLEVRGSDQGGTNDAQCLELGQMLTSPPDLPTVVSGDMNRGDSCAPPGWWTLTDSQGRQDPGVQHVYGDQRTTSPSATVQPMSQTDHDALVVRFSIAAGPPG